MISSLKGFIELASKSILEDLKQWNSLRLLLLLNSAGLNM